MLRQASYLLALPLPLIRVWKWQNEHFTGSQYDTSSKMNSYKAENNLVIIWLTYLKDRKKYDLLYRNIKKNVLGSQVESKTSSHIFSKELEVDLASIICNSASLKVDKTQLQIHY